MDMDNTQNLENSTAKEYSPTHSFYIFCSLFYYFAAKKALEDFNSLKSINDDLIFAKYIDENQLKTQSDMANAPKVPNTLLSPEDNEALAKLLADDSQEDPESIIQGYESQLNQE